MTLIYRGLAEKYGWTPDIIANLTHYQMFYLLNEDRTPNTMTFKDKKEYMKWKNRQKDE